MNEYIIEIGSIGIRWYSALILIGAIFGIISAEVEGKRFGISKDFIFNVAFWTIIIGIIGARAYYVLFNYNIYKGDALSMFKIWEGGLAIHGGIIAGLITIYVYCKKYNANFLRILDIFAPSLLFAQAVGRWGNFFNQEAHGIAVSLDYLKSLPIPNFVIEGMNISGIYYEPLFFYESVFCFVGLIILLIVRRLKNTKVGTCTSIYLMYYGIVRFFIESHRTDSLMLGGFKMAQIVSILMFVIGFIMILIIARKGRFEDLYNKVDDSQIMF